MKHSVTTFLAFLLIICFGTICYAEDNTVTPYASELITSVNIVFNITDNTATATVNVNGVDECAKIGINSLKIQEYRNGTWVTVASVSTQYNTNAKYYSKTLTYSKAIDGNQYRATVTGYASNGSVTETRTRTSSTKTA